MSKHLKDLIFQAFQKTSPPSCLWLTVFLFSLATNEQAPQGPDLPGLPEAGQDWGWCHHSGGPAGGVQCQEASQVPQWGVVRGAVLEGLPRLLWQPGQGWQGKELSTVVKAVVDCCYSGMTLCVIITLGCQWLPHSPQVHKSQNHGWGRVKVWILKGESPFSKGISKPLILLSERYLDP